MLLKQNFYDVDYMPKYYEKNILPDLTIAFNGTTSDYWHLYLNREIPQ